MNSFFSRRQDQVSCAAPAMRSAAKTTGRPTTYKKGCTILFLCMLPLIVTSCGIHPAPSSSSASSAAMPGISSASATADEYAASSASDVSSNTASISASETAPLSAKIGEKSAGSATQTSAPSAGIEEKSVTLTFAGDINFDDSWPTMAYFHQNGDVLTNVIDSDYLSLMNDADLMWINNEFTYSSGGSPLSGKAYTFHSAPSNVSLLKEMGIDIVGLANNHVYDYGVSALLDTFTTLENAGIPYVGAGRTLSDASSPVYLSAGDLTIAYVAASRAEKNKMTPQATDSAPGILRCYDMTQFLASVKEADKNADIVIALPHWGTEYSTTLENAQTTGAQQLADAGADAVIGAHTHCLQGMTLLGDTPVIYSLGNFWFNEKTLDTMLVTLTITYHEDAGAVQVDDLSTCIVPGTQQGCVTTMADTPEEKDRIYRYLESISSGITIDSNGILCSK